MFIVKIAVKVIINIKLPIGAKLHTMTKVMVKLIDKNKAIGKVNIITNLTGEVISSIKVDIVDNINLRVIIKIKVIVKAICNTRIMVKVIVIGILVVDMTI